MTEMSPAEAIYFAALEKATPAERAAYLDAACAGQPELRARVEKLLAAQPNVGKFLEPPVEVTGAYQSQEAAAPTETVGALIAGKYKLLQEIGEGGMGSVFMADQTHPVKRRVAVKMIKAGMDSKSVLARFEAERQALALMDHPHIAKVLDAGLSPPVATGGLAIPFFVMELVKGIPITQYCDEHKLPVLARLSLFTQVCSAVQHAHQKGIIHRDLKPSNILVESHDGKPVPKVIDFGLAKATSGLNLTEHTMFTALGQVAGTPLYMAPEQAALNAIDVDTRADIYALGVILYELLTGTTPIERETLKKAAFDEILRVVREQEPPTPSSRLSSSDSKASVAAMRQMEPARLGRFVRGELDWIVMKALAKERDRRYETANGFAKDIERFLNHEPVVAGPPSAAYKLRKFVRRNKGGVIAVAAVATALLIGVIGFAWQARIAQNERDVAQTERDTAQSERNRAVAAEGETKKRADELQKVSDFQGEMLKQVDPSRAGKLLSAEVRTKFEAALVKAGVSENDLAGQVARFAEQWNRVNATDAARELIDRTILKPAVSAIDKQFADQPVVDAALRQVLSERYRDLGLYNAALPLQERALATRRRELGPDHLDTIKSINNTGYLLILLDKPTEAEPFIREGLERSRRTLGEEHPETLLSINKMGFLLAVLGKLADAELYSREAMEKCRRVLGENHPVTLNAIGNMGVLMWDLGRLSAAEQYLREALDKSRQVKGEEHPETLQLLNSLAVLLQVQGKLGAAEPYYREVLEKQRRIHGEDHPDTLATLGNVGTFLHALGKLPEAESCLRDAFERKRRVLGSEHVDTLTSMANLGVLLKDQGKLSEAEPYLREAFVKRRRTLGEDHPLTQYSIVYWGSLLVAQGKSAEAIELLTPFEPAGRKAFTGGNAGRLAALLMNIGKARAGQREFAAAETKLLEAQPIFVTSRGPAHKDTRDCTQAIVDLYTIWHAAEPDKGYDAKAAEWKAKLEAMKMSAETKPTP